MALVLIATAAGFIAWKERTTAFREAQDRARSDAFFLADQADRLFEVADIALRATATALGAESWDAIEGSRSLWSQMKATEAVLPYVEDVWLNDATGRLRLTTFAFPAPASDASDREIFKTVRAHDDRLAIGDIIRGKVTDRDTFLIARRLNEPDGAFRGMVSVTADLKYFYDYWNRLDRPDGERIAIARRDGSLLIGDLVAGSFDAAALRSATASNPSAGTFVSPSGDEAFYNRIGTLPLVLVVTFEAKSVLDTWEAWLWRFLPFPAAALLALAIMMAASARQSRAEARAGQAVASARAELASANRRLEQRVLERTAELKESSDEIQRFAYIVGHDLRAPLVNIMGFTSELQDMRPDLLRIEEAPLPRQARDRLREEFDEALGFIQSSTAKMDRLIKAILLLSRGGQRRFHPERVDMGVLMRSVVAGVAHRAQTVGAVLTIGDLPDLTTDRMAVEQIFSNLIDNAVKYLRPGVPGRVTISSSTEGARAIFRVEDNGRGIDPKDRFRIFDLFRRAGPQDQPGEGIGLAHVRSLVRKLGGSIELESVPGTGSTFVVALPLVLEVGSR